jgi:formylglycine-generating enzyme required for sulfatase activity
MTCDRDQWRFYPINIMTRKETRPFAALAGFAVFCLAWQPGIAPAQAADGKLVAHYAGQMTQLRAELKAKLPDLKNEQQVQQLLASDALDAKLVPFVVLQEATPEGLAAFAQQGKEQEQLIERLLSNPELMKQMLVADGASRSPVGKVGGPAQYGQAMKLYTDIQQASEKAKDGVFQRLALAIAMEYAAPSHDHDPVKRYQHYEKAYLDGELLSEFPTLDAWSLRFVVNGNEPDWMLAWGRETLRNYRPDHVLDGKGGWRYSAIVRTNVLYGSNRVGQDKPELHAYQNILMNGGICGRRAFFGQFICRAFGNPAIKRPSKAHGAMARWTPKGWAVNLGPAWGSGGTDTIYGKDRAFLASSQARKNPELYLQVKRAMWIGDAAGEPRQYGGEGKPGTWSNVSLLAQQRIIKESKAVTLAPLGEELGEADEPTLAEQVIASPATEEDKNIIIKSDGSIEIPAAAIITPQKELKGVAVMKSFSGGMQMYLPNFGDGGRTILRGGAWKSDAGSASSERRIRESGLGGYPNWGFRLALTPANDETKPELKVDLGNGVSMDFVYIKPGTFIMGGESTVENNSDCLETPKHEVTLTKGFYLGKYEVTRAQFAALGAGTGKAIKEADHPQGSIRLEAIMHYCKKVYDKTGMQVRLPTEAEWEYAARAGSNARWCFGNDAGKLGDYAWFKDNSGLKSNSIGQKNPNPWGLYDMYGNVWEMVADTYDKGYYANGPKKDPTGPGQKPQSPVEYSINVPRAGEYALTARVVTMNYDQMMRVAANDDTSGTRIGLPFTLGMWKETEPVTVSLKQGENKLKFWRVEGPQYGIAVKSFTLKPAK